VTSDLPPSGRPTTPGGPARRASAQLPVSPASARMAREMAREVTGPPEDARIALIVTELVTNAISHAEAAPWFSIDADAARVRVEVFDNGPGRPRITRVDATATSGRGVALVDAVADRWGVDPSPGGKTVWAEVVGPAPLRF
jgi:anti-sigma regulatory factor (Ser/Thr protein kinase)